MEMVELVVSFWAAFSTSKGTMVRSILYQKPFNSKFYRDAFIFIGVLGIIGEGGAGMFEGGIGECGVRVELGG